MAPGSIWEASGRHLGEASGGIWEASWGASGSIWESFWVHPGTSGSIWKRMETSGRPLEASMPIIKACPIARDACSMVCINAALSEDGIVWVVVPASGCRSPPLAFRMGWMDVDRFHSAASLCFELEVLERLLEASGGIWVASGRHLGGILGHLGSIRKHLETFWRHCCSGA